MVSGITITPQRTYAFDVGAWVPEAVATWEPAETGLRLAPNPFSQTVQLPVFPTARPERLRVFNGWGQLILETTTWPASLDASTWPPGWYAFSCSWPSRTVVAKGLKQ